MDMDKNYVTNLNKLEENAFEEKNKGNKKS